MKLFNSGDKSSFICLTGFDYATFHEIHDIVFEGTVPKVRGRKPKLDSNGKLGCLLIFLNSTIGEKHLALIFGISVDSVSRTLTSMVKLVNEKLLNNEKCKTAWPSDAEKVEFAAKIAAREPLITNAIGFVDGLALRISCSDDIDEQNAYYNGWHGDTYVNNILVFSPNGKVIFAVLNYFGSWHHAKVAETLYNSIIDYETKYAIIADSAFPRGRQYVNRILKPIKTF